MTEHLRERPSFAPITMPASDAYVAAPGERAAFQETFRRIHASYSDACYPPPLFTDAYLDALRADSESIVEIFRSLHERFFGGDVGEWVRYQGGLPEDARLAMRFAAPKWMRRAVAFARPDFLVTNTGYALLEVNFSPALGGLGNCDQYVDVLARSAFSQRLREGGLELSATAMGDAWGACLRRESRASASRANPLMLVCVADRSELEDDFRGAAFCAMAERQGYRPRLGWIGDLDVTGDGVFHDGERVDVVYAYFLFPELAANGIDDRVIVALADADARGSVDFFSPPAHVLFDGKSNLELLTDPSNAHAFSPRERSLIERCVPETIRVTAASRDNVLSSRLRYVLKPAHQSGGRNILIGRNMSERAWQTAVEGALADRECWVAQQCVDDVWTYERREQDRPPSRRSVCLGPIVLGGGAGGILLRELEYDGTPRVINTHQGASFGAAVSARPVACADATMRRALS